MFARTNYQHVAQGEGEKPEGLTLLEVLREVAARISFRAKGAVVAVIVFWVLYRLSTYSTTIIVIEPVIEPPFRLVSPIGAGEAKYLHVLLPANKKDANLCKTLVSLRALNYPVPTLINWGIEFDDESMPMGGWHLGKIYGVLAYLNGLGEDRNGDLVVIPSSFETWFQLRPGTLIERYFEINRQANARIESRLGDCTIDEEKVSQRIVFSAQKSCLPAGPDDAACYAVPESILPAHVYGPDTDKMNEQEDPPYLRFRERYLDSWFIMGELGSLREMFTRALEIITANPQVVTAESTFAQIFGEQEKNREVVRKLCLDNRQHSIRSRIHSHAAKHSESTEPQIEHQDTKTADESQLEFGIGLDYEGLLGRSRGSAEHDFEWLRFNDTKSITQARKELGVKANWKISVATDITRSPPPFWTRNGAEDGLPQDLNWDNIPLYTNLWTGIVPAMIHHDQEEEKTESLRRESNFDRMWYHPTARTMMNLFVNEPYKAFAVMRDAVTETAWWPMHEQKWVTRSSNITKEWIPWAETCGGEDEEVFRDGKGNWKPPRTDY